MYRVMHLGQLELPVLIELPVIKGLVHELNFKVGLLSAYRLICIDKCAAFVHDDWRFVLRGHALRAVM